MGASGPPSPACLYFLSEQHLRSQGSCRRIPRDLKHKWIWLKSVSKETKFTQTSELEISFLQRGFLIKPNYPSSSLFHCFSVAISNVAPKTCPVHHGIGPCNPPIAVTLCRGPRPPFSRHRLSILISAFLPLLFSRFC